MVGRSFPSWIGSYACKQNNTRLILGLMQIEVRKRRKTVWMRFPEWERSAVVGQVVTLQLSQSGAPEDPTLFSIWRRDAILKTMPDWKEKLPNENVFNIMVRITPGGLGEGVKWATVMPKEMIPRYKPGWPSQ